IRKLNEHEAADLLEKHIDFIDPEDGRSVQCPTRFVNHYRGWNGGTLPKLVAISTLPLVLGNGEILAPRELDRLRGIAFIIDEKLRKHLPRERVRDDTKVAEALRFLVNDWMTDVKCSFTDKCNAITLALSIIERSLLADRAIAFITSPTPHSGNTPSAKVAPRRRYRDRCRGIRLVAARRGAPQSLAGLSRRRPGIHLVGQHRRRRVRPMPEPGAQLHRESLRRSQAWCQRVHQC